jgi:pantoate--beta-alanine ligase
VRVVATIAEARTDLDAARRSGGVVGLVPTMGYLHDGHRSLMDRSVAECDRTVATIFVNPLQFGAGEDLDAYPRDIERDTAMAQAAGVDLLLVPPQDEMYPEPVRTTVSVDGVSAPLEGVTRPSHFAGVATVVAKLFNIAGPCRAYFGEKDFQQLAVIRRMVRDLSFPVEVVACATVREPDGLAMSSRNAYLTAHERAAAPVVHRALLAGRDVIAAGERSPDAVRRCMREIIASEPLGELDYAEVVDAASFTVPDPLAGELRLLAAVRFGKARLIDNVGATANAAPTSPKEQH